MLLLFATDVLSLSGIFYTFSSSHSPLCSSHPWAELPQPEVPPLPHHKKKQKALKRKAATLMKMVQAGNTKTLPPEQSAAEHPAQALVHFMSPGHSLTPCSKWLMPPLGMGMLWATFWEIEVVPVLPGAGSGPQYT